MMYLYQIDKRCKSNFKLIATAATEAQLEVAKNKLIERGKNYIITNHEV